MKVMMEVFNMKVHMTCINSGSMMRMCIVDHVWYTFSIEFLRFMTDDMVTGFDAATIRKAFKVRHHAMSRSSHAPNLTCQ